MYVSLNEVYVNCYKAYRGLQRAIGEADKIALAVCNNEIIGLKGVALFAETLEHLKIHNAEKPKISIEKNQITVDARDAPTIECLALLLDAAVDTLSDFNSSTLVINNTCHQFLSIGALMTLLKKKPKIHATTQWVSEHDTEIMAVFHAGELYPNIYYSHQVTITTPPHKLQIIFSFDELPSHLTTIMYDKNTLQTLHQHYIKNGIDATDASVKTVKEFATAILVKETKESLKDAGE